MEPKFVYLFRSRDGFYKIGISNNVESRLASVRTSNHDNVEIVIARKIKEAFNFEQELHSRYEHRISRKSGEWFKLNSDEVIDICVQINLAEGEKPKIENRLLEKSLVKYTNDHAEIKESLASLKRLLSKQQPQHVNSRTQVSSNSESAIKNIVVQKSDDLLIKQAEDVVRNEGRASASLLQRKLSIGYARAARIIDRLYEKGIVGPQNGSSPRMVMSTLTSEHRSGKIVVTEAI